MLTTLRHCPARIARIQRNHARRAIQGKAIRYVFPGFLSSFPGSTLETFMAPAIIFFVFGPWFQPENAEERLEPQKKTLQWNLIL